MTFNPYDGNSLASLFNRADKVASMIYHRAVQAYCQAFGWKEPKAGDCLDLCILHNALIDLDDCRGWGKQVVDPSALRRANYLLNRQSYARDCVSRFYMRACREKRANQT